MGSFSVSSEILQSVVQIAVDGYNGDDVKSILDPAYKVRQSWIGSGFFVKINNEDGYILTNAHVVRNAHKIHIRALATSDESFTAQLVGLCPILDPDVALIRLVPEELVRFVETSGNKPRSLSFASANEIDRGAEVKAIGYPFGLSEPNVSGGEITNLLMGDFSSSDRYVTNAAINPGNSGGPAILSSGHVIGINTSIIINANNFGFITPIKQAQILLPQILSHGEAQIADLGARLQPNSEPNADYLGMSRATGVIATYVMPNGLAHQAGIQRYDVITHVNELALDRFGYVHADPPDRRRNIFQLIRDIPCGEDVYLKVFREGKIFELSAKALPRPELGIRSQPLVSKRKFVKFGGLIIQELSDEIVTALSQVLDVDFLSEVENRRSESQVLVITDVESDSPADRMALSVGDIITKINGNTVNTLQELQSLLDRCKSDAAASRWQLVIETQWGNFGVFNSA